MLGVLPNREIEPMLRLDPIGNLQALFACQKDAWRLSVVWVDEKKKNIVTGAMVETPPERPLLCSIFAQDEIALQGLFTQLPIPNLKRFILPRWAVPTAQKSFPQAEFSYDVISVCTKFDFQPNSKGHKVIRLREELVDQLVKDKRIKEKLVWHKNASCRFFSYGDIEDDQVVSIAECHWATELAASVGNVYTLPEYRNKGHATSVVAAVTKEILNEGKIAVYTCEEDNIASLNVCGNLGYWFYKSHGFMVMPI